MKKAIIFYSSQNGSTQKVAERMKSALDNAGIETNLFNTRDAVNACLENYDLIGIGCPTYICRPSYEIMDFLDTLKDLKNKNLFTFVTYGTYKGDGANLLRRKIREMHALDIGSFSCTGRNLFPGYTKRGYVFSPDSPQNDELYTVDNFIKGVLKKVDTGIFSNQVNYDPKPRLIYRFEKFVTSRVLIRYFYSRFFSIDGKRCTGCNHCIQNCPTKNVTMNDKHQKTWGRNCIFCLKCEISCPERAISSPISWIVFAPFLAINIRNAVKDKIPFNKVK